MAEKKSKEGLEARVVELQSEIERLQQEKVELVEHGRKCKQVFTYAVDAIFIIDPDTADIVDCNEKAVQRLGYTKKELLQLKVFDINAAEEHPEILKRIKKQVAGASILFETIHKRKNGTEFPVEVSSTLFETDGRKLILAFARDITERKQIEAEREKLLADLRQALDEIKTLQGIIPICSSCKKIRGDEGFWSQIEEYIKEHSGAEFTHSICPDCKEELYGDQEWYKNLKGL
jgi:PAS domain S-box-containing protein